MTERATEGQNLSEQSLLPHYPLTDILSHTKLTGKIPNSRDFLIEGLIYDQDSIHDVDFAAIDPNMISDMKHVIRLRLQAHHAQFAGLSMAFLGIDMSEILADLEQKGLTDFVEYSRWRISSEAESQ